MRLAALEVGGGGILSLDKTRFLVRKIFLKKWFLNKSDFLIFQLWEKYQSASMNDLKPKTLDQMFKVSSQSTKLSGGLKQIRSG